MKWALTAKIWIPILALPRTSWTLNKALNFQSLWKMRMIILITLCIIHTVILWSYDHCVHNTECVPGPGSWDVSFLFPNHGVISVHDHPIHSSGDIVWSSVTLFFRKFTEMEIPDFGNLAWITSKSLLHPGGSEFSKFPLYS